MVTMLIGLGSPSDLELLKNLEPFLKNKPNELGIYKPDDLYIYIGVASAHRNPEKVKEFASACLWDVIVAGAGLTNVLVSEYLKRANISTIVVGLPISDKATGGLSSLLSSSELPPGYPVGCVGINCIEDALMLGYTAAKKKYDSAIVCYSLDSTTFGEKISSELKKLGVNNEAVKHGSKLDKPNQLIISAMGPIILDEELVISGYQHSISAHSKTDVLAYVEAIQDNRDHNTLNVGILNPTNVAIYAAKIIGRNNPEILMNIEAELMKGRQKYAGHEQMHVLNDLKNLKKLTGVE